jgi:hypothetical protein
VGEEDIDFELIVLLIESFTHTATLKLAQCSSCRCAIVVDNLRASQTVCSVCHHHVQPTTLRRLFFRPLVRQQAQQHLIQHEQDH